MIRSRTVKPSLRNGLSAALLLALIIVAPAYAQVSVLLNGSQMAFDVPPRIEGGRTLVPLRAIFEGLGAEVRWDGETRTVTAVRGGTTVVLPVGSKIAQINGQAVVLDVPAVIIDGRTLVPLRFVSEALGARVGWDGATHTVTIEFALAGDATQAMTSEDLAEKALPLTVLIETEYGTGSGFFLDGEGTVVTNHHVISGASRIWVVTQDSKRHNVTGILASDAARDLAVLQTEAAGYQPLRITKDAILRAGQDVVAIGSPLGLSASVSKGVVSNPLREIDGRLYIQHTAPISPGSSGGPLLLLSGEVAGVNTAAVVMTGAQNLNFAVPASEVAAVLASRRVQAEPLPRPSGAGSPSAEIVTLYRVWLEGTFIPWQAECATRRKTANEMAMQGLYGSAAEASLDASECLLALINQAFLAPAAEEIKPAHFNLIMDVAMMLSSEIATGQAYSMLSGGDSFKAAGVLKAVLALQAMANEYQQRFFAEPLPTWATPSLPVSGAEYWVWVTDTFDPEMSSCFEKYLLSAQAMANGRSDLAEALAIELSGCFHQAAWQAAWITPPPEARTQHFNRIMAAAYALASQVAARMAYGAIAQGNSWEGNGMLDAAVLLLDIAKDYKEY